MQYHTFPRDFYEHLRTHTLTGIKAGKERTTFLDIWMVTIEGRVFARSWGKNERSWFTTLINEKTGQIKYGNEIISITAALCKDHELNRQIDHAYRERYTSPENLPYAIGITQPEYAAYTMEFICLPE